MSALSELLKQRNREGLSANAIAEKARARGHKIGHDTVWKYMSGGHGRVSEPYLRALADVLPVRYEELRKAAAIPPNLGEYVPPAEASALDRKERAALDVLIRSIARSKVERSGTLRQLRRDPNDFDVEAANQSTEEAGPPPERDGR